MGGFIILFLTFVGVRFIASSVAARQADQSLQNYVQRVDESDCASNVMSQCQTDASALGYALNFDSKKTDYNGREYPTKAVLKYTYKLPFAGSVEKVLVADIG